MCVCPGASKKKRTDSFHGIGEHWFVLVQGTSESSVGGDGSRGFPKEFLCQGFQVVGLQSLLWVVTHERWRRRAVKTKKTLNDREHLNRWGSSLRSSRLHFSFLLPDSSMRRSSETQRSCQLQSYHLFRMDGGQKGWGNMGKEPHKVSQSISERLSLFSETEADTQTTRGNVLQQTPLHMWLLLSCLVRWIIPCLETVVISELRAFSNVFPGCEGVCGHCWDTHSGAPSLQFVAARCIMEARNSVGCVSQRTNVCPVV